MTKLTLSTPAEARARRQSQLGEGAPFASPAHLADELRAHVLALGSPLRTSLIRRVTRMLAPVSPVEETAVEDTCRALERRGDILSGPGGVVAPAPLRQVETHGDCLLVAGSLPTPPLRALLPGGDVSPGIGRTARVAATDRPALLANVQSIGGRLLSAEDWAGLPRAPHAGAAWLEDLAQRLANEAGSDAAGLSTRWDDVSVYEPPAGGNATRRWQNRAPPGTASPTTPERACLLRARQPGAWSAYGWGILRGPNELPRPFVPLTRDEARRTEYAVDRAEGKARTLAVSMDNGLYTITLDMVLPAAEYRFLLALADERREDGWPVRLSFTGEAWGRAAAILEERLGLRTKVPS